MKFAINDFFSKCEQIFNIKYTKTSFMENFHFYEVIIKKKQSLCFSILVAKCLFIKISNRSNFL